MPLLTIKYSAECILPKNGFGETILGEGIRVRINDEKIQSQLVQELHENNIVYFTETGKRAFDYSDVADDIKIRDPGSVHIDISERDSSKKSLKFLNEFIRKHNLRVRLNPETARTSYLTKLLASEHISVGPPCGLIAGMFGVIGAFVGRAVFGAQPIPIMVISVASAAVGYHRFEEETADEKISVKTLKKNQ